MSSQTIATFYQDAVLFDMDGTLTDSIAAVEAAWGKVAADIGQDPAYVIAATHGKRAVDNLAQFKPHLRAHEMDGAVAAFEETILFFADAYRTHGPGSRSPSPPSSVADSPASSAADTPASSAAATPALSPAGSEASSRASSFVGARSALAALRRPSFLSRLSGVLTMSAVQEDEGADAPRAFDDPAMEEAHQDMLRDAGAKLQKDQLQAWQLEAAAVDRSVRILPGVKDMIASIPEGRYAVATSGARTYAHGCMTRVGITPPKVTITADDKRLKAGKPAPDPFLLAARELGFDAARCVVFEDSPSGIRAGVAAGATVVAVCTSHERAQIEGCGAHYIVENMNKVACRPVTVGGETKLQFTIFA